jgi:hypothetical protein
MPRSLLTVTLVALTQVALPSAQTLAAEGHTSDAVSPATTNEDKTHGAGKIKQTHGARQGRTEALPGSRARVGPGGGADGATGALLNPCHGSPQPKWCEQ